MIDGLGFLLITVGAAYVLNEWRKEGNIGG
jgi:hypothetical protein